MRGSRNPNEQDATGHTIGEVLRKQTAACNADLLVMEPMDIRAFANGSLGARRKAFHRSPFCFRIDGEGCGACGIDQ